MKKISILRFLLIALFINMCMAMSAETIGDFEVTLDYDNKTAELLKYNGSATELAIPSSVTLEGVAYSVTSIGESCFYQCESIKSISIPESVKSIGTWCFGNCSALESIAIPESVTTLEASCFSFCTALKSITIPESVITLEASCFDCCSALQSITIPKSVTSIGNGCFVGCSALEKMTVAPGNSVYDSRENCNAIIKTATNEMISGCKTTVIPSTVTSLGFACFSRSSLETINIPSSVTSLGPWCFEYCDNLKSITLPSSVTTLGNSAFAGAGIQQISIPESVTSIGARCFQGCYSLLSVTIPSSLTSLAGGTFSDCTSLLTINIPESVTSIGPWCFQGCSSLASIIIPKSVTSLGDDCFAYCYEISEVTCKIATPISGNFFSDVPINQATLKVPETSLEAYRTTEPWSGFGTIEAFSTSGINNNYINREVTIDAVYDLDGKISSTTSRGIKIVRMSDGTTRKVKR